MEVEQIFSASADMLSRLGLNEATINALKNFDWSLIEQDFAWLDIPGNHALMLADPLYPPQLKEIADPPQILFVRGNLNLLSQPQIAIVGSRNPSRQGLQCATEFAEALAGLGFVITSGLALGIDAASHQSALQTSGYTIAVAGTGPDRVYPARHKKLAEAIIQQGAIISEFPPGASAHAHHFPRRNRIISGLSLGLLVVEATRESGSLISARLAMEQNREVFAIPGSIYSPLARGCNALIQEGAKLVETVADILDELGVYNQQHEAHVQELNQAALDLEHQNLLKLIAFSPTPIDYLVQESGLAVEIISSMLLTLEIQDYIVSASGGTYIRIQ